MRRRLTVGLALLRVTGMAAVVLLLWNPVTARLDPGDAPPLVLLDASLSMSGHGGTARARWRREGEGGEGASFGVSGGACAPTTRSPLGMARLGSPRPWRPPPAAAGP